VSSKRSCQRIVFASSCMNHKARVPR
jgi:hypothetical protein